MDSSMSFCQFVKYSMQKLLFEMFGTMLLSLLFLCSGTPYLLIFPIGAASQVSLLLGLWVLIVFGYKISGAHYNPAISLAFMFRRDIGHFPRPLGLAYILFQCIGAVLGSLLAWLFNESSELNVYGSDWKYVFQICIAEILGSFILVLFYLT